MEKDRPDGLVMSSTNSETLTMQSSYERAKVTKKNSEFVVVKAEMQLAVCRVIDKCIA